jgi:hypothetical protein
MRSARSTTANRAYGPFCSTSSTFAPASRHCISAAASVITLRSFAELVGPTGKVTAIEIDAGLAEKARAALKPSPQITVSNADGATLSIEPADLIRETEDDFAARFLCQVGFIDFSGARDPEISRRLATAFARDWARAVQSTSGAQGNRSGLLIFPPVPSSRGVAGTRH